jgi:hypothetical protein
MGISALRPFLKYSRLRRVSPRLQEYPAFGGQGSPTLSKVLERHDRTIEQLSGVDWGVDIVSES